MWLNRGFVAMCGRLEITGALPPDAGDRSILLAANHIGVFDAFVLTAACHRAGVAPRFLIAGGIMDAPVVGWALRNSGHLRVDRRKSTAIEAFRTAVATLRDGRVAVLVYPEGRISHDPGLWPERGKSGVARLALAAGAPVVPISQWGAHESAVLGHGDRRRLGRSQAGPDVVAALAAAQADVPGALRRTRRSGRAVRRQTRRRGEGP